jgi:hypothetical protein
MPLSTQKNAALVRERHLKGVSPRRSEHVVSEAVGKGDNQPMNYLYLVVGVVEVVATTGSFDGVVKTTSSELVPSEFGEPRKSNQTKKQ